MVTSKVTGKLAGLLKAFSTLTWVIFMWIGTYVRIHQAFRISMAMNFVTCVLSLNRKKKKRKKEGGKHLSRKCDKNQIQSKDLPGGPGLRIHPSNVRILDEN